MDVTLTATTRDDAEQLAQMRIAAMCESLENIGRFDPERARRRFLDTFEPSITHFIDTDGERVGFVVVKQSTATIDLAHLYILPQHQGRGIGTTVLQTVFAQADAQSMIVTVGALKDSASNRFYQRHGFIETARAEWDIYYSRQPIH